MLTADINAAVNRHDNSLVLLLQRQERGIVFIASVIKCGPVELQQGQETIHGEENAALPRCYVHYIRRVKMSATSIADRALI